MTGCVVTKNLRCDLQWISAMLINTAMHASRRLVLLICCRNFYRNNCQCWIFGVEKWSHARFCSFDELSTLNKLKLQFAGKGNSYCGDGKKLKLSWTLAYPIAQPLALKKHGIERTTKRNASAPHQAIERNPQRTASIVTHPTHCISNALTMNTNCIIIATQSWQLTELMIDQGQRIFWRTILFKPNRQMS